MSRDALGRYHPDPVLDRHYDALAGSGRGAFSELRRSLSLREVELLTIVNPQLQASILSAGVRRQDHEVQLGTSWDWLNQSYSIYRRKPDK